MFKNYMLINMFKNQRMSTESKHVEGMNNTQNPYTQQNSAKASLIAVISIHHLTLCQPHGTFSDDMGGPDLFKRSSLGNFNYCVPTPLTLCL